ncbi:hypothetical protein BYT27DRAFT_6596082 [Phlegmacium glaucopus]|nr:hypothetical protein BYT27DRAFT_6596082 [Phlegmacium glaucopus]
MTVNPRVDCIGHVLTIREEKESYGTRASRRKRKYVVNFADNVERTSSHRLQSPK